jgi:hypothetical protein
MKSLSGKLGVIFLFIGLTIFDYAEVWGENWNYIGESKGYVHFYDAKNVKYPFKGVVRVWTILIKSDDFKNILKEREKEIVDEVAEKIGDKIKDKEKVYNLLAQSAVRFFKAHRKDLFEIKCGDEMFRVIQSVGYNENRETETIEHFSNSVAKWDYIVPESVSELLHKAICK